MNDRLQHQNAAVASVRLALSLRLVRLLDRTTIVRLTALLCLSLTSPARAAGAQLIQGVVPAAVARLSPVGRLAASERLNLAIGLPLRNQEELNALLKQLYDPASTNYHHYLNPEQFTERFGPTAQDYQAVVDFATTNGLTVTRKHSDRIVLDVNGSVADIEKAFHVTLRVYQHPTEARTFHAPDVEPSLDVAVPILHISGLDDFSLPHPNLKPRPSNLTTNATPNAGSGPSGSYIGNDFRAAYVPGTSLTGAGQSVGLLEFDGYYTSDITNYEKLAGLPNVMLTNVPVDGGVTTPGSGNDEVALDIEMVISMAPGVSNIYIYEAPNPSPWEDLLSQMFDDNSCKQISCSWGGGSTNPVAEEYFQKMATQGQSFFNASGDSDAFTGAIPFPSDSPNITQVGGTTLATTGSGGSYVSETVWNWRLVRGSYVGSSGGVSTYYGMPSYQQGVNMSANLGSTTMRNVPDVALTADNVYVVYHNGKGRATGIFGGTSCAAPLWAAFTALVNQQSVAVGGPTNTVGFLNPAVYAIGKSNPNYTSLFHDITNGNNFDASSPTKYPAVPGYDLCTGWGTPAGTNLINALAPPATVAGRWVFYNNSAWDGNDPTANANDDHAIAPDKTALLPGGTATFANYTSYSRGLNGIMVDIANLLGAPTVSDFVFKSGNNNNPTGWSNAPAPASITVRAGAGTGGSDRVTLIWKDNNLDNVVDANEAVAKQWLEVTVKATTNTGLAIDDVFFFGNAVGDSGNSTANAQVDLADEIGVRNNPATFLNPAAIDDPYDYNRDQRVDLADEIIARNNSTTFLNALELIVLSSFTPTANLAADAAVDIPLTLTIQQRGTDIWIMCHGPAQITPLLTTARDLAQGSWTAVNTSPTYNADDPSWTWHLEISTQRTQAFYRLAGTQGN